MLKWNIITFMNSTELISFDLSVIRFQQFESIFDSVMSHKQVGTSYRLSKDWWNTIRLQCFINEFGFSSDNTTNAEQYANIKQRKTVLKSRVSFNVHNTIRNILQMMFAGWKRTGNEPEMDPCDATSYLEWSGNVCLHSSVPEYQHEISDLLVKSGPYQKIEWFLNHEIGNEADRIILHSQKIYLILVILMFRQPK